MSSIDQQFVEYIVKSLVGNPDAVVIERSVDDKGVLLELTVDPEDLGRIIGKRGATAQSLRTLLRALGTKNEARYNLKIVDNGPEDYVRPERPERQVQNDRPAQAESENTAPSQAPQQVAQDDDAEVSDEQDQAPTSVNSFAEDLVAEVKEDDNRQSDMARKTRAELEDLDDLDI
jgi:predicted RNA-binding protein YlqC (UPF0109 family)